MDTESDMVIGRMLREMRCERGLTQLEVADSLICNQSFVSKVEAGKRSLHVSEIYAYATALDCDVQECVERIGNALMEDSPVRPLPGADRYPSARDDPKRDLSASSTTGGTRKLTSVPSRASSRTIDDET